MALKKKKAVHKKPAKKAVKAKVAVKKKPVKKAKPAAKAKTKPVAKKKASKPAAKKTPPKPKAVKKSTIIKPVKKVTNKTKTASKSEKLKTRYNDKELQEFKALIENKLEASRKELKYLHEQINRTADIGGDDSDNKFSGLEDGTGTSEKEYLSQMASRQITYIDHLEKALVRIANKTYGVCRVTGKLISKERLRAVPHATLSIEAKKAQSAGV